MQMSWLKYCNKKAICGCFCNHTGGHMGMCRFTRLCVIRNYGFQVRYGATQSCGQFGDFVSNFHMAVL
ncbi:hypothetical protein V6Z11_A06G096200 [Gossypium hirsutum]